ncbi:MAG: DinB family protein [Candidatus Rokubacteria bacterium]|nr:DinB family protein [Candidatus Rokubacteria bacterium]MBI3827186.1 DinB family protein [Candidatus Rokubacteria bacterium]
MSVEMVRSLYAYHRWANRRLFDVVAGLGEATAAKEIGPQFSFPTLKGMLAHIYGADYVWLTRWKGSTPARLPGDADFATLADLRGTWDALETEQTAHVEALTEAALARGCEYKNTAGKPFRGQIAALLQHVANHATHHRSELPP